MVLKEQISAPAIYFLTTTTHNGYTYYYAKVIYLCINRFVALQKIVASPDYPNMIFIKGKMYFIFEKKSCNDGNIRILQVFMVGKQFFL